MATLTNVADQFRRDLLARERASASEMVRAYGQAWQRIRADLDALTSQIEAAQQASPTLPASWLFQQRRLQALQAQVEAQIRDFARNAEGSIRRQQQEAVEAAERHAQQIVMTALRPSPEVAGISVAWNRLPIGAVEQLIGTLQDGSPLRGLLDLLGPAAGEAVKKALVTGLALGQNPREIARQVRREMGMELSRALTISRTEVMRSYREASRRSYQANRDVVAQWLWQASLSPRTCAACIAMHGTLHDLDEPMGSHPCCRCVMVPVTKTFAELGIEGVEETRATSEKGTEWFARQPESVQAKILGPAKLEAYRAGRLTLPDLVGYRDDPRWGPARWEASLEQSLRNHEAAQKAAQPSKSAKAILAQQTSRRVGAEIQRYSEEHCEPILAKALGGDSLRDNEPADVVIKEGEKVRHGIELKTMTDNKNNKLTMKADAMAHKAVWIEKNNAAFHTVVFDDQKVFNAMGPGEHDESQRVIYYRRGYGSFRVNGMYRVRDMEELATLLDMPNLELPQAARPSEAYLGLMANIK